MWSHVSSVHAAISAMDNKTFKEPVFLKILSAQQGFLVIKFDLI